MQHQILYLNSSRTYVLVEGTWYDTRSDFNPSVGSNFLLGKIEQILSYEEYKEAYPESNNVLFPYINDVTPSGGFIRKVCTEKQEDSSYKKFVRYSVNPESRSTNHDS